MTTIEIIGKKLLNKTLRYIDPFNPNYGVVTYLSNFRTPHFLIYKLVNLGYIDLENTIDLLKNNDRIQALGRLFNNIKEINKLKWNYPENTLWNKYYGTDQKQILENLTSIQHDNNLLHSSAIFVKDNNKENKRFKLNISISGLFFRKTPRLALSIAHILIVKTLIEAIKCNILGKHCYEIDICNIWLVDNNLPTNYKNIYLNNKLLDLLNSYIKNIVFKN